MDVRSIDRTPLALVVVPVGETDAGAIVSVLEELGLRSRLHHDAGSALEAVEYDRPALVVHGWDLPDMDAVTFHGAVRKRARGRRVPTLAIAPDPQTASRIPDDAAGLSQTLVRPLQRALLAERLGELVDRARVEGSMERDGRGPTGEDEERAPALSREPELGLLVVGLGEWGTRAAEIFDRQGLPARALDVEPAIERSTLPEELRHRVAASGDLAAAMRELAADAELDDALAQAREADLCVVVADLSTGAGSLAASVLARLADVAPRAGRHLIARLAGVRSNPDQRALGLVALNAVLEAPSAGIFLVVPADGAGLSDDDTEPGAPLYRLLELWSVVAGAGPADVHAVSGAALGRFLSTPGFIGWRETSLSSDDIAPDGRGWHEIVAPAPWQPEGFEWEEAQEVLALARLPWPWLQGGGRRQFERLVRSAWEEAAPCGVVSGLHAGDPATAILVSAGMPFPRGILDLRDSVAADRERLADKRRRAATPIPLDDDILPPDFEVLPAAVTARRVGEPALPEPALGTAGGEKPLAEAEPIWAREPALVPDTEAVDEAETVAVGTAFPRAVEEETAAVELDPPAFEAGPMPLAYESALALVRRILGARDLRAEVDLGEVRYALYDLLEILREEPLALLPEVFRPELDEYFERHHVNVAILAILAGDLMRGSLSEVIDLGTAALLHDCGMLATRETWDAGVKLPPNVFDQAIRPHPEIGYHRIHELAGMTGTIARMVLEEHERMDGSGYPRGLAGASIDSGARVLAACDSLEAMTHPRPYRDHLSPGEALARLQVLGQYTLDPTVVQALTKELKQLLRRGATESERR